MIILLNKRATPDQMITMLAEYESMIKIVVDVRRKLIAGGGEMHSDSETLLVDSGSENDDLWGANWYPAEQRIAYESLINIRPGQGNRSIVIQNETIRSQVLSVVIDFLGGIS